MAMEQDHAGLVEANAGLRIDGQGECQGIAEGRLKLPRRLKASVEQPVDEPDVDIQRPRPSSDRPDSFFADRDRMLPERVLEPLI